jgi:predicted DNA-binding protein
MGRPSLNVKATVVRLPITSIARIRKLTGRKNQMASFIRQAVEERLQRMEAAAKRKARRKPK